MGFRKNRTGDRGGTGVWPSGFSERRPSGVSQYSWARCQSLSVREHMIRRGVPLYCGGGSDPRVARLRNQQMEGQTVIRVAETLHIKLSTIRSRVRRARLFLRRRLADYMSASLDVARLQMP